MIRLLRSYWSEPRPAAVPRPRADRVLLAVLLGVALLEVVLRDALHVTSSSFLFGVSLMPSVLWRRSHPLWTTALVFAATGAAALIGIQTGREGPELHAQAFLLVLPYALFRWGSGREALLGLPIVLGSAILGLARDELSPGESAAGLAILMAPMALGAAARYRHAARQREMADVRASERLQLARELHDTVAHHVSAIAVRAQAGIATSVANPAAAVEALDVIGKEASRTLNEMRGMVRVLRDDEAAELAPAPRWQDLLALAQEGETAGRVPVEVVSRGSTAQLSPGLVGVLYRIARESITNAHRHARGATRVQVDVDVSDDAVRLRVQDDGELVGKLPAANGYGLLGMAERAQLFGGTLVAGPCADRGWAVTAVLPRGSSITS